MFDLVVGECRVTDDQVITFDGVVYHPHLVDKCHYMLVATTGTYRDKLVILLERGSSRRNQVISAKEALIRLRYV